MAPPIDDAPVAALRVFKAMHVSAWDPQIAYAAQGAYEFWQVVGVWDKRVRLEGWWRRPLDEHPQWKAVMMAAVREDDHDPADFCALDPSGSLAGEMRVTPADVLHNLGSRESGERYAERLRRWATWYPTWSAHVT